MTEFLNTQKRMVMRTGNTVKPLPEIAIRNASITTMLQAADRLGMTPAARSRIQGVGDEPEDPLAELIRKRDEGQRPPLELVK